MKSRTSVNIRAHYYMQSRMEMKSNRIAADSIR